MDDSEMENLRQQTEMGTRVDEEDRKQARRELTDELLEELAAIEDGDRQKTVSVWDGPIAALVATLEDRPEDLERLVAELEDQLEVRVKNADRSSLLRLVLRAGLHQADPELLDVLEEAIREHATQSI